MGGRYPALSPSPSPTPTPPPPPPPQSDFMQSSRMRIGKVLRPSVVLSAIVTLLLCSVIGFGIGMNAFQQPRTEKLPAGLGACHGFIILGAAVSMLYIIFHAVASFYNKPIGDMKPPEMKLHTCCYYIVRAALFLWLIAIIPSAVVVGKPNICLEGSTNCRLQVLDLVITNFAFIATGVLLTALEACQYPFEIPEQFTTGISCRVSSFGDDYFEQSSSSVSSFETSSTVSQEKPKIVMQQPEVQRSNSTNRSIPGEFPTEPQLSPSIPMLPEDARPTSAGWSEEVNYLISEQRLERQVIEKVESTISLESGTSTESEYSSGGFSNAPARVDGIPRVGTASSNISDESLRSPLSMMRVVENPDVVVQPEMRVIPPPVHEWPPRAPPTTKLLRTANPYATQRRPARTLPSTTQDRRTGPGRKPIARKPVPLSRRRTIDIKVPGAFGNWGHYVEDDWRVNSRPNNVAGNVMVRVGSRKKSRRGVKGPRGLEPLQGLHPLSPRMIYCRHMGAT